MCQLINKKYFIFNPKSISSFVLLNINKLQQGVLITGFLTFLNCWNVRVTTKLQDFFMVTKIGALLVVILAGLVWLCMGKWNKEKFFILKFLVIKRL